MPLTYRETEGRRKAQYKYNHKPEQIHHREERNLARRHMIKAGRAHKGDGKDVEHIDGHPDHNVASNWRLGTQHDNRSYKRTPGGHKQNPDS